MQKMPFSRFYSYLEKTKHSHVRDQSLQFFNSDHVELPIVKPLYIKKSDPNNAAKMQSVIDCSV